QVGKGYRHRSGYMVQFDAEFFSMRYNNHNLFEFPFFSNYKKSSVHFSPEEFPAFLQLVRQMEDEYESEKSDQVKALRSYLNIVLIHCKRAFPLQIEPQVEEDHNAKLLIQSFTLMIEEHFREKHLVREYAEMLNLTPNYLNVVCRERTGKSAGELIRDRIMLEAKRMLAHDDLNIAEIGYALHFTDNAYFSRFFKKYEGISPDQFRKQRLVQNI
ncbi:MAG: helix-turn-helix domain-containing protein, partial [Bacteroidota bacterium]